MNPQNNAPMMGGNPMDGQNADPMMGQSAYGGPNISYENYDDNAVRAAQQPQPEAQGVPINVINAVNANGIVSGRKLVDESWKSIAIAAIVIAVGCLIGVIVAFVIQNSTSAKNAEIQKERDQYSTDLKNLYSTLGVSDYGEANNMITSMDILSGADLSAIDAELEKAYPKYVVDFADATINSVTKGAMYKIVSVGIAQEEGTARAILYSKVSDGQWKLASYDKTSEKPCKDASDEDKKALRTVGLCEEESEKK